ncbi:MAG: hypothetical protein ACOY94_26675 [Bacillota bacterium]
MRCRKLPWTGLLILSLALSGALGTRVSLPTAGAAPLPDLRLEALETPEAAPNGFTARVRAVCSGCAAPVTTSVSLRIEGFELYRVPVTFYPEPESSVTLSWATGFLPEGAALDLVAVIDPGQWVEERDEQNNSLSAWVSLPAAASADEDAGYWGSRLTE